MAGLELIVWSGSASPSWVLDHRPVLPHPGNHELLTRWCILLFWTFKLLSGGDCYILSSALCYLVTSTWCDVLDFKAGWLFCIRCFYTALLGDAWRLRSFRLRSKVCLSSWANTNCVDQDPLSSLVLFASSSVKKQCNQGQYFGFTVSWGIEDDEVQLSVRKESAREFSWVSYPMSSRNCFSIWFCLKYGQVKERKG